MDNAVKAGLSLVAVMLAGTAGYAAIESRRPVMPAVVVDLRPAEPVAGSSLMLIYGENGTDPARAGRLATDQRVASCDVVGSRCVSKAARLEYGATATRLQSLQVRLLTGGGNPVVGALRWTGPLHPRAIRLVCDLRVREVERACAIAAVTV